MLLTENIEAWNLWHELHGERLWHEGVPAAFRLADMVLAMDFRQIDAAARESLVRRLRAADAAWRMWFMEEHRPAVATTPDVKG